MPRGYGLPVAPDEHTPGASDLLPFDPLVSDDEQDAHALYGEMRATCPVAHSDRFGGFWAITRYDDLREVLTGADTFITSVQNVVPAVAFTGRRPPLHLDPPEHRPYRSALSPAFRHDRVRTLEGVLRDDARVLLRPLLEAGSGDYGAAFSIPYPVQAFARILNVPVSMMERISGIATRYNAAVQNADDTQVKQESLALYGIARELIAVREREPADPSTDLTTSLLQARTAAGEPLPPDMVLGTVRQVLVVGIIAPTVVLGSIVKHLAEDPGLQDELRASPDLIGRALEEFLRLYSPYRGFARTPTRDVVLGGQEIHEGEPIAMIFTSANRDETVFDEPHRFRLDRPNIASHIAFGLGAHRCPGATLARLELRVALEELLAQTEFFALDGPAQMTRWPEYGVKALPVRLVAAGGRRAA